MSAVLENVIYQHAENATFLWMLRNNAVDQPHYNLDDLYHLDDRVEANIDGLRIAGIVGFDMLQEFRADKDAGALFATAVLATEQGNTAILNEVFAEVEADPGRRHELVSAFAWVNPKHLGGIVKVCLQGDSEPLRAVGFSVCITHGRDPGSLLDQSLAQGAGSVEGSIARIEAIRCAGELGRVDLLKKLVDLRSSPDALTAYHSLRSGLLLGERQASVSGLARLALSESPLAGDAVDFLVSAAAPVCKDVLRDLSTTPGRMRDVIRGFGLLGDPVAVPWLLNQMQDPAHARLAGEAISMITGVDIAYQDLDDKEASDIGTGPNDDPADDNVAMDEDEDLPWPSQEKLTSWWQAVSGEYPKGQLYIAGHQKNPAGLKQALKAGWQRQRHCAGMGLALSEGREKLFDTRAPARLQRGVLN